MGDEETQVLEPGQIAGYTPPQGDEPAAKDYFAFDETEKITLPDGVSWVLIQKLNEGDRAKYQNKVNRDVKIARTTGDASVRMAPGDERRALLEAAVVGWNLQRGGQSVPFSKASLSEFLDKTDPAICDLIEKQIRKTNAWLLTDMTVEEIDKEIETLQEQRRLVAEQEEGKGSSSGR